MSASNGGNRRWKNQERSIATALGASLVANVGVRRSDMELAQYGIEAKTMKAIPARVSKAMDQSVDACIRTGKVPVVVLNQPRIGRKPLRFVVMRLEDWQANNAQRDATRGGTYRPDARTSSAPRVTSQGSVVTPGKERPNGPSRPRRGLTTLM